MDLLIMKCNLSLYEDKQGIYWIITSEDDIHYDGGCLSFYLTNERPFVWMSSVELCSFILDTINVYDVFVAQYLNITEEEARTILIMHGKSY